MGTKGAKKRKKKKNPAHVVKYTPEKIKSAWKQVKSTCLNANQKAFDTMCPFGAQCRMPNHPDANLKVEVVKSVVSKKWGDGVWGSAFDAALLEPMQKRAQSATDRDFTIQYSEPRKRYEIVLSSSGPAFHSHHLNRSTRRVCDASDRIRSWTPSRCSREKAGSEGWRQFRDACGVTILICRYCHAAVHNAGRWDEISFTEAAYVQTDLGEVMVLLHKDAKKKYMAAFK